MIRRRLRHLPPATVDLLGVAAVIGRDVDLGLLARVAGAEPAGVDPYDAMEAAVTHRVLTDVPGRPGTYRFTHALVREVLLDDLTSLRRARLHLRVADAVEASGAGVDDLEILAEHLWQAAAVGAGGRAAAALERAAEVAVARVDYAAAERHLARAAQLHRTAGDERAELAAIFRLMEVTAATRGSAGADRVLLTRGRELARHLGEHDRELQLFYFEGGAIVSGARVAEVEEAQRRYLERIAGDPRTVVQAGGEATLGISAWLLGHIRRAAAHLQRALELFGPTVPEDAFVAEQLLNAACFDLIVQGMIGSRSEEESFATFDLLAATVPPPALPPVCAMAVDLALLLGRHDVAAAYDARVQAADPSSDFALWGGQLVMQRGLVEIRAGAVDAGLARFAEGAARYRGTGARAGMALFLGERAAAVAAAGDPERGDALLDDLWAEERDCGEGWSRPHSHEVTGLVAAAVGDGDRAAHHLAAAAELAEAQGSARLAARSRDLAAGLGIDLGAPGARPDERARDAT